jgi:hypothetical protein
MSVEKIHVIGIRSLDLPACSIVPKPTTLPRAPACTYFSPHVSYSPYSAPGLFFSSIIIFYTDGRTSWMSDKPVARPLPVHRTTQTEYIYTQTSMPWGGGGFRTPGSRRSSERRHSCIRPCSHCDRPLMYIPFIIHTIYIHITGHVQKHVLYGRCKGLSKVILTIRDLTFTRRL